jgi:hypothetical protein
MSPPSSQPKIIEFRSAAGIRIGGHRPDVQIPLRKRDLNISVLERFVQRTIQLVKHTAAIDRFIDPAQQFKIQT